MFATRALAATLLVTSALHAQSISPKRMKAHVDFLASDLLEGRETGSRGYDIAASYVAAQLAAAGVAPAGDGGTYLQNVRFNTYKLNRERSDFCIRAANADDCKAFEHRKDVNIGAGIEPMRNVEASVVHAGFGIVAPSLNHDDYANLDVRGKVVVVVTGAPPRFPPTQRAHYSSADVKREAAVARGAIGFITLRSLDTERRQPWARMIASQGTAVGMRALNRNGQPFEEQPQLRASVTMPGGPAAEALFAGAPKSAQQVLADADLGIPHSFPLTTKVRIRTATELGSISSPNVVGMVKGSSRRDELVVLTAHLDHLGVLGGGTDRIRNGALDNGSGIAALIEIARRVATMKPRPARSIVFVAVTGEEKGVQGSLAFADEPSVPGKIVANVNMDMLTMLFPMKSLVALGAEHSTLGPLAKTAAERAGFVLQSDPQPEEVRFIRSDQYSFVQKGIPAITYKGGLQSLDPAIDGDKLTRDWLRNVYHSVDDEPGQQIHYATGARWAEANLQLVVAIANAAQRPRWNDGDFFGELFGKRPLCLEVTPPT